MSENDSLDDLLSGRDRFMTAGEVAELLNVNTNTLYLWRQSGEVDLPFHRFIAPGQSRGMIRYRYSDVAKFIQRAEAAGRIAMAEDDKPSAAEVARAKKERERELERPLEELIEEVIPDQPAPEPSPRTNDIIAELLKSYAIEDNDG